MKVILLCACVILSGCSTVKSEWTPEASMMEPCAARPKLASGSGKDVLVWGTAMRSAYDLCAAKHKALINAVPKKP